MTYKFDGTDPDNTHLFQGAEIVDPTITIDGTPKPKIIDLDPNAMTITVLVNLKIRGASVNVLLRRVVIQNLTYDEDSLMTRVLTRLEDFIPT